MTYTVRNFGPIVDATIKIRPLTILCGANNTGKSYLTYSLYALLDFIRNRPFEVFQTKESERDFLTTGQCVIDLTHLADLYNIVEGSEEAKKFKDSVSGLLKLTHAVREKTSITLSAGTESRELLERSIVNRAFNFALDLTPEYNVRFVKHEGKMNFRCTLEPARVRDFSEPREANVAVKSFLPAKGEVLRHFVPTVRMLVQIFVFKTFIFTCERTGVSTFRPELSMLRDAVYNANRQEFSKIVNGQTGAEFDGYSMPIERELSFAMNMAFARKGGSAIGREIMPFLEKIAGGEYRQTTNDSAAISYMPSSDPSVKLQLRESSSSVRTLSELYFYLHYDIGPGETIFIDEPELNLHPAAQRMMARLFTRLVNRGVKIFITTHSDYIIREVNALTRLAALSPEKRHSLLDKYKYEECDLLDANQVGCYVLQDGVTNEMRRNAGGGFAVSSFDDTIESFNSLYGDLCDAEG